jgi:hypothetical protein
MATHVELVARQLRDSREVRGQLIVTGARVDVIIPDPIEATMTGAEAKEFAQALLSALATESE